MHIVLRSMDMNCRAHDGSLLLRNPHIEEMEEDHLYHFSLSTSTHDLKAMFSDIKVSCIHVVHFSHSIEASA